MVQGFGSVLFGGPVVGVSGSVPNIKRASTPETAYGCTGGTKL
jgi:hypothetical protein